MSIRGYSGVYKGYYLKSSYEYVMAVILDHDDINWRYEEQDFDLGMRVYRPDFFLYNTENKLYKVIEVKSNISEEIQKGEETTKLLKELYGIPAEVILRKDLSKMCKERGLKITKLIENWKNMPEVKTNFDYSGKNNPHFGMKHSELTKKKIGERTRQRIKENPEPYLNGLLKGAETMKRKLAGIEKTPREIRKCEYCGKSMRVLITSKQRYCSPTCSGNDNYKLGLKKQAENTNKRRKKIKEFIIKWTLDNKDLVLKTPYNKITTNLKEMFDEIDREFGVNSRNGYAARSVSDGKSTSRKQLLDFMKELVRD